MNSQKRRKITSQPIEYISVETVKLEQLLESHLSSHCYVMMAFQSSNKIENFFTSYVEKFKKQVYTFNLSMISFYDITKSVLRQCKPLLDRSINNSSLSRCLNKHMNRIKRFIFLKRILSNHEKLTPVLVERILSYQ